MAKHILLTLLFTTVASVIFSQEGIKWYTWEEGMMKAEKENKKFVIDMYTDWCGWCKKMDKATFQNPVVAEYVNENYIAIKFDAEQKENITFKGEEHKYVRSGRRGYHTLAAKLTNGRLSYPTVVFLDEDQQLIQAIPGYQGPQDFHPIAMYFAEDLHHQMPWSSFITSYKQDLQNDPNHSQLVGNKKP